MLPIVYRLLCWWKCQETDQHIYICLFIYFVCMCVCVCARARVCVRVCLCVCARAHVSLCEYKHYCTIFSVADWTLRPLLCVPAVAVRAVPSGPRESHSQFPYHQLTSQPGRLMSTSIMPACTQSAVISQFCVNWYDEKRLFLSPPSPFSPHTLCFNTHSRTFTRSRTDTDAHTHTDIHTHTRACAYMQMMPVTKKLELQ